MTDLTLKIEFQNFYKGMAPLSHLDTKTYLGSEAQASEMKADIISYPGFVCQSPGLADLTNGSQAGVVDQLIRFILEQPTDSAGTTTYALGTTKMFKLTASAVTSGGSPSWPQAVTNMTEGESLVRLGANLFGFYNKSSGGDILAMPLSTEVIDPDWGSTLPGGAALQKAVHPVAVKEDIMVFGNGQYLGVYIAGLATLSVDKLDFGAGAEVADVVFMSGFWWIAVNYGDRRSQLFMYDGSALSNILSDEAGIGTQKIGFLYVLNGVVYVAYTDSTSGGYALGYLSGRVLKPLRFFAGSLPNHRQKTLYKNTILFVSTTDIWSCGASVSQLPIQISKLCDGGHATLGAIAAPFGTPLVASTDGATNFRLARFSAYSVDSVWKSIVVDLTDKDKIGMIDKIIVYTKALGAGAKATIQLEGNQGATGYTSTALEITGTGKTRHVFTSVDLKACEDLRAIIDYSGGSASVICPIRKIVLLGHFVEE